MIENVTAVITGIIGGITAMLTPSSETVGALAPLAALFAIPIVAGVAKKVTSLIKSTKGK